MEAVGLTKKVTVLGKRDVSVLAKFDTGASRTSIGHVIAKKAGLGPVLRTRNVRSASRATGQKRKVVLAKIRIGRKTYETEATLSNRSHSKCKVLIGRDIILGNFRIDISKTHKGIKETDFKP